MNFSSLYSNVKRGEVLFFDIAMQSNDNKVRKIVMGGTKKYTIVTLGRGTYLAGASFDFDLSAYAHVLIGNYCSLAHRLVFEIGSNHNYNNVSTYPFFIRTHHGVLTTEREPNNYNTYQIIIGNDVWIGCDVTILSGVRIGNGAVIGAGTMVTKDVPPYAVVVGNPGRIIKYRFEQYIIEKLQRIKWWYWKEEDIFDSLNVMQHPDVFVERYEEKEMENDQSIVESINMISELSQRGFKIFDYILDVNVDGECWQHVLEQYKLEYASSNKVVLLLGYDKADHEIIKQIVNDFAMGNNMPFIFPYDTEHKLQYLKIADYFIVNREAESGICADYADMYNVKLLPALAQRVFQGIGK